MWCGSGALFEEIRAREVHNPRPGVDIQECDLVRNYVLGHFATEEEGASAYYTYWLEVERAVGGKAPALNAFLREFLQSVAVTPAARRLGEKGYATSRRNSR